MTTSISNEDDTFKESKPPETLYKRLFHNPSLLFLWSGETISDFGDEFFLLAASWIVYIQSSSILQTALIQVIWHLDRIIFSPLAGILADRWSRKRIMVITNLFSALVTGLLAAWFAANGPFTPEAIFVTVFLLNSLATFYAPASQAILPDMVGKEALVTTSGLFSASSQMVSIVGSVLAGLVITTLGNAWAIVVDSLTFFYAMIAIALAHLPRSMRKIQPGSSLHNDFSHGWKMLAGIPVVWMLTWLGVLLNVAAFMGPLYPALVRQQLEGNATILGLIATLSGIGALCAGLCAGPLERTIGAGRLIAAGWSIAGLSIIGMAFSRTVLFTAPLEGLRACCITISTITSGSLMQGLLPEEYRGRGIGIIRWLSVMAIPVSALLGGWLADRLGVAILFAAGGCWILGISAIAWLNHTVREARFGSST